MGCELCKNDNRENIDFMMGAEEKRPIEIKKYNEYNIDDKGSYYSNLEDKLNNKYAVGPKKYNNNINIGEKYKIKNNNINEVPLKLNQNKNEYIINTLNIYNNNKIQYSRNQNEDNKMMETNTISNTINNNRKEDENIYDIEKKEEEIKNLKKNLRKQKTEKKNRNKKSVKIKDNKNLTSKENEINRSKTDNKKRKKSANSDSQNGDESENNTKDKKEEEEGGKKKVLKTFKHSYTKQISKNTEKINEILKQIRHSKIDKILSEAPLRTKITLEGLTNFFKKDSKKLSEVEKAWLIYKWVTENIEYDYEGINAYTYDVSEEATFNRGKTISSGLALLYKKICENLNLNVEIVEGFAKEYSFNISESSEDSEKHDWNAIQIEKEWYLIDPTWGSGYIQDQNFIKQFNPYFFFTPPQEFVRGHLPFKSKWQLLPQSKKVSQQTFMAFAPLKNEFFSLGFSSIDPDYTFNDVKEKGKFDLYFEKYKDTNHQNIKVKGKLYLAEDETKLKEIKNSILEIKKEDCIEVNYLISKKGNYKLKLFGNDGSKKEYDELCTFDLKSEKDVIKPRTYPTTTELYYISDLKIIRPNNGTLKEGNKVTFELKTTTFKQLFLGINTEEGDNYIEMGNDNNRFIEEDFLIYGKKALIVYKDEKDNNYNIILEFEVIPITKKKNTITYPQVYSGPKNKLIEPICDKLKKGKKINFAIKCDLIEEMVVSDGDDMHKLNKKNGVFTGSVKISGKGEVKIMHKKENGEYGVLYTYKIF